MKRILLPFFSLLFLSVPAFSETDAKTIQFLEDLNLRYYCLMREGCKGFTCDVSISQVKTPTKKQGVKQAPEDLTRVLDKLKFSALVISDGTVTVTAGPPASTMDANLDAIIQKQVPELQATVQSALSSWVEVAFKPAFDQKTYAKNCKIIHLPKGFKVNETGDGDDTTTVYDGQAKALSFSGTMGSMKLSGKTDFLKTEKGYLPMGTKFDAKIMGGDFKFKYQIVDKYQLIQSMDIVVRASGVKGAYALIFSNYQLNP